MHFGMSVAQDTRLDKDLINGPINSVEQTYYIKSRVTKWSLGYNEIKFRIEADVYFARRIYFSLVRVVLHLLLQILTLTSNGIKTIGPLFCRCNKAKIKSTMDLVVET